MSLIPKKGTVYVVDDDEAVRDSLQWLLEGKDYRVKCFDSSESFLSRFDPREVACLIADIRMDGMSGIQLLNRMKEKHIGIPVIIMTGYGTIDSAVEAIRIGACDYISKPFEYDEILHRAKRAIEQSTTARDIEKMQQDRATSDQGLSIIVGRSQVLTNIKKQLKKI